VVLLRNEDETAAMKHERGCRTDRGPFNLIQQSSLFGVVKEDDVAMSP
jgi:hypothetical protein